MNGGNIPVLTSAELKETLANEDIPRRKSVSAEVVHEYAVAVLHILRGLPTGAKRRVLTKAGKLLGS